VGADTGRLLWTSKAAPQNLNPHPNGELLFGQASVQAGFTVAAYSAADGSTVWERGIGMSSVGGVGMPLITPGGLIVTGTAFNYSSGAMCLHATTGEVVWNVTVDAKYYVGSFTCAGAVGGTCDTVIAAGGGSVVALDVATGATVWTFSPKAPNSPQWQAPVVTPGGTVVLAPSRYSGIMALTALDSDTGKQVWQVPMDFAPTMPPVVDAAGTVFYAVNGDVTAVDGTTGKQVWTVSMAGSPVITQGAISDGGQLVVLSPFGNSAGAYFVAGLE